MNSKLSANVLNLSAGNSRYNYLLDTEVIEASNILFQYNTSSDSDYEYDAFIYKLFDNNLVMDSDTGYINFTCIGIDANKKNVKYNINIKILDFFNNIVKTVGEYKNCKGYIVPEVIVDFGGKNA